jgi:hypothetical protein
MYVEKIRVFLEKKFCVGHVYTVRVKNSKNFKKCIEIPPKLSDLFISMQGYPVGIFNYT